MDWLIFEPVVPEAVDSPESISCSAVSCSIVCQVVISEVEVA